MWVLLCQNCHQHSERNQVNIIKTKAPPVHGLRNAGPKRTLCAPPGKLENTTHAPLETQIWSFQGTQVSCARYFMEDPTASPASYHICGSTLYHILLDMVILNEHIQVVVSVTAARLKHLLLLM